MQHIIKRSEQFNATEAAAKARSLLEDSKKLEQLKNEEMYSALAMGYIKMLLGKNP